MPDAAPASGRHVARLDAVQTACALLLAVLASFRAIVGFEPFPWWSSDPFEFSSRPEHVLVRGQESTKLTRGEELTERYKTQPPKYGRPPL